MLVYKSLFSGLSLNFYKRRVKVTRQQKFSVTRGSTVDTTLRNTKTMLYYVHPVMLITGCGLLAH